jgi:hypothetical protein
LSDNLDNLLGDIYSSSSQSQGVKELANLINNLSSLLLKAISQLEARVMKLEQQVARGSAPRPPQPSSPAPPPTTRSPMPKAASPFSSPASPPPPPPRPAAPVTADAGPGSAVEAASMLGVTLKKAPTTTPAATSDSGPSFLTGVVNPDAPAETSLGGAVQPDAAAPASMGTGGGVAGPGGGFRGELAEKLARRRQKVSQQIEDDFDAPDLALEPGEEAEEVEEESTSSELKGDLEDELRSAFSKLKG